MTAVEGGMPETAPPLREFVAFAWLHWRHGMAVFATIFVLLALVAALIPPRFRADAALAVLPAPEFTVRPDAGSKDLNASALALDQIMKAESEILASDALHEAVLRQIGLGTLYPDLAAAARPGWVAGALRFLLRPWLGPVARGPETRLSEALTRMSDRLSVHATKDGNVIELSFDHRDPVLAARALNALLDTYAQRRTRLYDDPQSAVVRGEAASALAEAAAADRRLAAFKASHAIAHFDAQRDLLLKRLSDARQAAADAAATAVEQGARADALARAIRATPASIGIYHERDADSRLQTIDDGLVELRGRLAAALVHYRETSRMVGDLRRQVAAREAERARLAADPSPSLARAGRPPALDQLELDRDRAVAERDAAGSRQREIRAEVSGLESEVAALEGGERTLDELQREKDMRDEALRTAMRVMAERRMTEAEDAQRLANVRVIQPARVPQAPTPLKLLLVLAGLVGGAMAALGALLWDFVGRPSFLTAEGLAEATGLPVLGVFRREPAEV